MTEPRISVAMATCEGGAFVHAQLESLACQTRLPDEVVVCDDASTDATFEILQTFARGASFPIRVERNSERLGSTRNFGRAVGLCTGDILFLADQDDYWLEDKIERQIREFDDPGLTACFSDGRVVDADGEPLGYGLWQALWFTPREQRAVRAGHAVEVFLKHVVAAGNTLAFRAEHRDLYLPFPALRSCHDSWIAFLAAATGRIEIIERPLVLYRLHGDNQIGLGKPGLLEQLSRARQQLARDGEVANAFDYADRFFTAALQRLASADPEQPTLEQREQIEAKITHARRRGDMSGGLLARLRSIGGEAVNGNYWRYSYGLKSIAQDAWLR